MGLVLWIAPLAPVVLSIIINKTRMLHLISVFTSFIMLAIAGYCTNAVMMDGVLSYKYFNKLFFIDSLSIIILDIIVIICFLASIYSVGYLKEEVAHGQINEKKVKLYYILMYFFMFSMVTALTVDNIGILWVAIEATTLASTFLVGYNNDNHSIEAAWKYIIICSVGIAIALVGIIFMHLSSVDIINSGDALKWNVLTDHATDLNSPVLRLSFIFIMIGFGTKAGLAPMHTWLPDAHSQAPSPISAMLSGVLLNSAMYAIIRSMIIVNRNLGDSHFTGSIMIGFGLLSIAIAAIFLLTQKDYKRLLAYSSIEHMGIIVLAFGLFTPLSVFAAIYHMINHSFTKSMLFLASGSILHKYHTRTISRVRGLFKALPFSGTIFLLGLLAITGTPPFSIFASELNVFIAIFDKGHFLLGAIFIMLLAIIFAGIASTLFKMFFGDFDPEEVKPGETNVPGVVGMLFLLAIILFMGLYVPDALIDLITAARNIIIGG